MDIFGGVITKLVFSQGSFLCSLSLLLRSRYKIGDIFGGLLNLQIFLGVLEIPIILGGVNGRCWVRANVGRNMRAPPPPPPGEAVVVVVLHFFPVLSHKTFPINSLWIIFQDYLKQTDHPLVPVCCFKEGRRNRAFQMALAA